jgi:predicted dithiol-disulfide oxidoreductase (DUF899 family)
MPELKPAADLAAAASKPYPNDSAEYRKARSALLIEEIELRRRLERVAEQRRALPLGGEPPDYDFKDENGKTVKLADLFGAHDTLVTYFWMYGPERERPCPMCTAFLGSMDIPALDIAQRVAFAVIGRSPVERQLAFARERGWRNLRFYSTVGDDFARDYRGLAPDGSEWPALDVWVRRGKKVHHFWAPELGDTADPGEDPRGAPGIEPLWNILDLTPGGRGTDWYPKLSYANG